ncbi:hypothetical protein GS982_20155 [Rhodococcus hoagii]|nr:hypothetical protein [Prescottella equi]NKZ84516.1 hypothetical protein [Prescottella equi]
MADTQGRSKATGRTVGKSSGKHIEKGIKFGEMRRNARARRHLTRGAKRVDDGTFIAPGHVAGVHYDVPKAAAKPAPKTSTSESTPDRVQVMAARLKVQLENELGIKSEQRYIDIAKTPVAGDPPSGPKA